MLVPIAEALTARRLFKLNLAGLTILALLGLSVSLAAASPPPNDNFGNATQIDLNALPFSSTADITEATTENGENFYCNYSYQTVWYKLTPTTGTWLGADTQGSGLFGTSLTVWRDAGSGIYGLSFVRCSGSSGSAPFYAQAGTTYYLQAMGPCCGYSGTVRVNVEQGAAPVPVAAFYFYPGDPSIYDTVQFYDYSTDPGQQGFQSQAWDFGDGATATGCCPTHHYAADGDYTVHLAVTTTDGRTASTRDTVSVRTHDVAITKFSTPQSASAGQTRQISVGIRNSRYPETVRVELDKSVPGGFYGTFQPVGYLEQLVPVRPSNRTTDFSFSYTFTDDDASIGKVTFKAVATILSGRDVFSADNEAISSPVKVSGSGPVIVDRGAGPGATPVAPETAPAARLALLGVAPNPAHAGVDLGVRLSLASEGAATLQVIDIAGRVMANRDLASLGPGIHETRVAWDRKPEPGIYWVRLTQRDQSVSTRVGILR